MFDTDQDEGYLYPDPGFAYQQMVQAVVTGLSQHHAHLTSASEQFFVLAVRLYSGKLSTWGIFDLATLPHEDLVVECGRRFYAAARILGESNIESVTIVNANDFIARRMT